MKQQPHWGKVLCKAAGTLEAFRGALCWHLDSPMLRERRAVHFSSMPIISILSFPVISQTVVLPTSRFLPLWWQEVHAINYLCSAGKKTELRQLCRLFLMSCLTLQVFFQASVLRFIVYYGKILVHARTMKTNYRHVRSLSCCLKILHVSFASRIGSILQTAEKQRKVGANSDISQTFWCLNVKKTKKNTR